MALNERILNSCSNIFMDAVIISNLEVAGNGKK